MSLEDLVNVTISADTISPSAEGFGTILCFVTDVPAGFPTTTTKTYTKLTDMISDGWEVMDPGYILASKIWSAKKRVNKLKFYKRSLPPTPTFTLTCLSAVEGDVYDIEIAGTPITYTVLSSATTTTVATAIELLIEAVTGITSSSAGAVITFAGASGALFNVKDWSDNFLLENTTADPGIATDLAAALVADSDWYGLALDSNSKAEIMAAATWVEANKKLFTPHTNDTVCLDSGVTTDVMSELQDDELARTGVLYNGNEVFSYAGAAWMGGRFPFVPGSYTWAFKSLPGVSVDVLEGGDIEAVHAKNGNVYTEVARTAVTQFGTSASGEFLDVTQGIDALTQDIQVRVFGRMANLPKIPFTDAGLDIVGNEISGSLKSFVKSGFLDPGNEDDVPAPAVTVPKVSDISAIDRAARHATGFAFSARIAGAIHMVDINGVLSV
jgi:hypothetical protein